MESLRDPAPVRKPQVVRQGESFGVLTASGCQHIPVARSSLSLGKDSAHCAAQQFGNEVFTGREIRAGDDTALILFALRLRLAQHTVTQLNVALSRSA
jgi:hypothetical protein